MGVLIPNFHGINAEICRALGLDPTFVTSLELSLSRDQLPAVTLKRMVSQPDAVNLAEVFERFVLTPLEVAKSDAESAPVAVPAASAPSGVLAVMSDLALTIEQREQVRQDVMRQVPGIQVVVLGAGLHAQFLPAAA